MTAATWDQIHAGDTVRGADQRVWQVVKRDLEREWRHVGREGLFTLALDNREIEVWRMLADPAPLVERADHSGLARATQALIDSGIGFKILEDSVVTTVEPQAAVAEVKRDRWGRYLLPDPETGKERAWTRVTTIARVLADEYNLGQWAERMVARGMALRPDLVAGAAAADPDTDKQTLQSIAQQAKDAAGSRSGANLGTALHNFTERLDRGEPLKSLSAPPPLDSDLRAYTARLQAAQLTVRPEFVERIVVVPELGVAGTIDRLVGKPDGAHSILDLKTAKNVEYSWLEIAIQQAIYAGARIAWNPATGTYDPMPENVDRYRGYVMHLPVGKATAALYTVDLVQGWRLAQIAVDVKAARSKAKTFAELVAAESPDDVLKQITKAQSQRDLAALWDTYQPRGLWTSEVNSYAQARLRHLAAGVTEKPQPQPQPK